MRLGLLTITCGSLVAGTLQPLGLKCRLASDGLEAFAFDS
jgi:hypothetical protein